MYVHLTLPYLTFRGCQCRCSWVLGNKAKFTTVSVFTVNKELFVTGINRTTTLSLTRHGP